MVMIWGNWNVAYLGERRDVTHIKCVVFVKTFFFLKTTCLEKGEAMLSEKACSAVETTHHYKSYSLLHVIPDFIRSLLSGAWRTLYTNDLKRLLLSLVPTESNHKTGGQLLYSLWRGIKVLWRGSRAPCHYTTWEAQASLRPLPNHTIKPHSKLEDIVSSNWFPYFWD